MRGDEADGAGSSAIRDRPHMFPIEIAAEFAFGERGGRLALPVIVQRQPGAEVRLDETVEERALGAPAVIDGRPRAGLPGGRGHGYPDREIMRTKTLPECLML